MLIPKAVRHVAAAALDEPHWKFAIDSVHLTQHKDGRSRAVATDGRMLLVAEWEEPAPVGEGKFPDYNAAIPNYKRPLDEAVNLEAADHVMIVVDPLRLAELLNAMAAMSCDTGDCGCDGVTLRVPLKRTRALLVEADNGVVKSTGVLMPVKAMNWNNNPAAGANGGDS